MIPGGLPSGDFLPENTLLFLPGKCILTIKTCKHGVMDMQTKDLTVSTYAQQIISQVRRVVVGKDQVLLWVLAAILSRGHILLEDIPGVGKTTLALAFSRTLGLRYNRVQFTPDVLPSDVTGYSVLNQATGEMVYQPGAVLCNLFLADELNRATSRTQSALLEAMEERNVTVDGVTHPLPVPFVVLATQNPVGSAGTQNLPNSQLDRFLMKLHMGYPDLKSQIDILKDRGHGDPMEQVAPIMTREELTALTARVGQTYIADSVYDYIARLAEATRQHPMVQLGVSPRGALALCRAAKAGAFVRKRDYVTPEDVRCLVKAVFAHRLILSAKARLNDCTAEMILEELLNTTAQPAMTEQTL